MARAEERPLSWFIVAIASSEEVIFRGALMGPPARRQEVLFHRADRDDLLRVATRSLVVPIIAHVVWDLGILVVWPLVQSGG